MKKPRLHTQSMTREKGLSLIELMTAMVIIGILASAAAPAMRSLFERKSTASIGDYFVKSVKLARVEAIQRGRDVTIETESGSGDWSEGWRIETLNDNGNIEVIRSFPALSNAIVFTSNIFGAGTALTIKATGQVSDIGSFELYYPDCEGTQHFTFNLLLSGLVQRGVKECQ